MMDKADMIYRTLIVIQLPIVITLDIFTNIPSDFLIGSSLGIVLLSMFVYYVYLRRYRREEIYFKVKKNE